VALREANILQAEALVKRSQDQLRTLLNLDVDAAVKGQVPVPADKPEFKPYAITLEEALAKAMARRPDLETSKATIATKSVNFRFARTSACPARPPVGQDQPGISGQQFTYDPNNPFLPPSRGTRAAPRRHSAIRSNSSITTDGRGNADHPFGTSWVKQLRVRQARPRAGQARLKTQEQQVFLDVSDAVRTLETAAKSADAYRIRPRARGAAARGRDEEAQLGMSTNLFRPSIPGRPGRRPVRSCGHWSTTTSPGQDRPGDGTTLEDRDITLTDYIK